MTDQERDAILKNPVVPNKVKNLLLRFYFDDDDYVDQYFDKRDEKENKIFAILDENGDVRGVHYAPSKTDVWIDLIPHQPWMREVRAGNEMTNRMRQQAYEFKHDIEDEKNLTDKLGESEL